MSIPRWGFRNNVKYNPRRCLLKICPMCDQLFLHFQKGYRIYCSDVCAANAHRRQKRIVNRRIQEKRDKYAEAERLRISYAQNLHTKKRAKPGTVNIPKPTVNNDGEPDWEAYHKYLTNKLKQIGMK